MIENLPGSFNTARQLGELLDPLPEVGLHLDIGHCNLLTEFNTTDEIMAAYGSRLKHVHLHDNKGGSADLHLPLGTGTVDVAHHVRSLQSAGYDGTITLEVFSPDRHYLAHSRDLLSRTWDQCAGRAPVPATPPNIARCAVDNREPSPNSCSPHILTTADLQQIQNIQSFRRWSAVTNTSPVLSRTL